MLFITTYKIKPFQSKAETTAMMEEFAASGSGPGVIAHYVAGDNSDGVLISENDDITESYANIQNYTQWVEYETKPMLTIEQALPHVMAALA